MAKWAPANTLDQLLDYVALSSSMVVCSSSPVDYTSAAVTYRLASGSCGAGEFTKAAEASGRSVSISAKNAIPISVSGSATHMALINVAGSSLRYITTITTQYLVSGGTCDAPSWKITVADPT